MEFRPVAFVIGLLLIPMGASMLPSAALDFWYAGQSWTVFAGSAFCVMAIGGAVALSSREDGILGLTIKQAFLLTTSVWVVLPVAGAIPFVIGVPGASLTDAYFEAMSGMTTTGSTVFVGLDDMPEGTLLWRSILQWLGGLGIVIVAFVFLPVLRVGGMQFFKSEGFDTLGKVLPRAADISRSLLIAYICLTVLCALAYILFGMVPFEAIAHALTTVSTGGFSTTDQSFAKYSGVLEYVSVMFMILASLPFIRFVQLMGGRAAPLLRDVQARAFVRWVLYACALVVVYRMATAGGSLPVVVRETVFNIVTLFTGTGYGSADVTTWGGMAIAVIVCAGLIGGCTASTGCSIKVFRWMILFEAIKASVRRISMPHRVAPPKLGGQAITNDVLTSVAAFFTLFILTLGVVIVLLSLTGLSNMAAITAGWTAIANVGPAYGPEIGPTGAMDGFPEAAKWIMIFAMLAGRLELLSVFVLVLPSFWKD